MRKVFLYLYPIKEYSTMFAISDEYCEKKGIEKPFEVINECIQRRYREKGYEVIITLYPDKESHKIDMHPEDNIIYTDVTFKDATGYHEDGTKKVIEEVKYPSEDDLLKKVGYADEIVVGGYHYADCVKRVAEHFYNKGLITSVDLELTDLFFGAYRTDSFKKDIFDKEGFKKRFVNHFEGYSDEFIEERLKTMYDSPVYGLDAASNSKRH